MSGPPTDLLWQQACQCLQDEAWTQAEGLLWRLWQLLETPPWEVRDALGYCLLMQGSYCLCEQVLRPVIEAPGRSFWVSHKLADALRGQARLEEAEGFYSRSEAEGSDSPLTARNHLQVLYQLAPERALARLDHWHGRRETPQGFWAGACQAALLVPGLELAAWLWRRGRSDGPCRRRLLEASCYELEPQRCWQILAELSEPTAWERALSKRLLELGLAPGLAATGESPGAGE